MNERLRRKNELGFSLLEMLVVVGIMAIMGGATVWTYVRRNKMEDAVQAEGLKLSSFFRGVGAAGISVGRNVVVDLRKTAVCSGTTVSTPQIRAYTDYNFNHTYDAGDYIIADYTVPHYCDGGKKEVKFEDLRTTPTPYTGYGLPAGVEAQIIMLQRGDSFYNLPTKTTEPDPDAMSGYFMRISTNETSPDVTKPRKWFSFGICTYTGSIQILAKYATATTSEPCF